MKQLIMGTILAVWLVGCNSSLQPVLESSPLVTATPTQLEVTDTHTAVPTETQRPTKAPTVTPTVLASLTPSPTATAVVSPTTTDTATITPTPTGTGTPTFMPGKVLLGPMNHQWQTENNCHRASIAILMGYYDVWFTQHDIHIGMDTLQEFLEPYGLTARIYAIRYAEVASSEAVRWLLAKGIPVIMGQKLSVENPSWHYRVVHGYDQSTQQFAIDDPLLGNIRLSFETFDRLSRGAGQIIPVYPVVEDEIIVKTMYAWKMKLVEYPH